MIDRTTNNKRRTLRPNPGARREPIADVRDGQSEAFPRRVFLHRWETRCLLLVLGLLCARLVYAAVVPLDLISDEAYYWEWSRRLDWGYYSKPPMIAWIIGLSTRVLGSTTLTVRLPAVLLGTLGLAFVFLLGRRLYDARTGFWAAAASAATPGATVLALMMTIDAPLLFCWGAALYCLWRMFEPGGRPWAWFLPAAVATGLGLLSKQTMLGVIPLTALFLLTSREDRRWFARPVSWCWVGASLAFLTPVLWWNSRHGWITFDHTRGHFSGASTGVVRRLATFGEYLLGQGGVVSPVTCLLATAVGAVLLGRFRWLPRRERFLVCFGPLPLAGVLVLSLAQRIEPNWTAPFYTTSILLTVGWAMGHLSCGAVVDRWRRWFVPGVAVGAACCLATWSVPFAVQAGGLAGSPVDPTLRLRGWRQLAREVDTERSGRKARTFLAATTDRGPVSELAFYLDGQPEVFRFNGRPVVESQYELWDGPRDRDGWTALILTDPDRGVHQRLASAFDRVQRRRRIVVPLGNGTRREYDLHEATNFHPSRLAPLARLNGTTRQ